MKHPLTISPWIMALALLAFSACQKDASVPEPVNLPELPGLHYLGRGYNAFGDYATAGELKAPLISFRHFRKEVAGAYEYKVPEEVEVQAVNESRFESFSAPDIEKFQNQLQASAGLDGGFPFFSGAIAASFEAVHYRTTYYAFALASHTVNRWKIALPYDAALLRAMLTEEARTALATLPPAQLFGQYGTHLLTAAAVGGRADYYVAAEKSQTGALDLAQAAEAAFKASLGDGRLNVDPQDQEMAATLREHSFIGVRVQGGNPAPGQQIFGEANYHAWLNSVDENPALCGFSIPGLMPIWELCETGARRAELEEAFRQYAAGFELPPVIEDAKTNIAEVLVKSGPHEDPYYYQAPGYKVIPENLNDKAGGDYVYLMYKEGLDAEPSVTELATVSGANPTPPPGWFRIAANLNEGTGTGDPEIYLCYQRAVSDGPIRQIRVVKGEGALPPEGFKLVKNLYFGNVQDLNHGTDGQQVFLAFSREDSRH